MRRISLVIATFVLLIAACGEPSSSVEVDVGPTISAPVATAPATAEPTAPVAPAPTAAPAPVVGLDTTPATDPATTLPPPTTITTVAAPTTTAPATTTTTEPAPVIIQVRGSYEAGVVLVAGNDTLNVRTGPGTDHAVLAELAPDGHTTATGRQARVGSTTWHEVVVPEGLGWVHGRYLAEMVGDGAFATDATAAALLGQLGDVMSARGDLSTLVSPRGLLVVHYETRVCYARSATSSLLTNAETSVWRSLNDPEEEVQRTFTEAIADSYLDTYDDPDVNVKVDEPWVTGNSRPADQALPIELLNFHFFSVIDLGDDGDDWVTWHVSIDYVDGRPYVVGLTKDEWSP